MVHKLKTVCNVVDATHIMEQNSFQSQKSQEGKVKEKTNEKANNQKLNVFKTKGKLKKVHILKARGLMIQGDF